MAHAPPRTLGEVVTVVEGDCRAYDFERGLVRLVEHPPLTN